MEGESTRRDKGLSKRMSRNWTTTKVAKETIKTNTDNPWKLSELQMFWKKQNTVALILYEVDVRKTIKLRELVYMRWN